MLISIFKREAGEKKAAIALQGEMRRGEWGQSGLADLTQVLD